MDHSRRTFLSAAAIAPALVPVLQRSSTEILTTLMDIFIPASDQMPSASEAGCLVYLQQAAAKDESVAGGLHRELDTLEAFCARSFQKQFLQLASAERVAVLQEMESNVPLHFAFLRDLIYEAYYTRPQVWKLLGYELFPTSHVGPHLEPVDESLLSDVRSRGKLYREA